MEAFELHLAGDTSAIVYKSANKKHFAEGGVMKDSVGSYKKSPILKKWNIAQWYGDSKNREPENILNILLDNNIAPAILDTKAKLIAGSKVNCYKEVLIEGKKTLELIDAPEIQDWFAANNFNEELFKAATDYVYFGNAWFEVLFNKGKKVDSIFHQDATTARAQAANENGIIENYLFCGDWKNAKDTNVVRVNAHTEPPRNKDERLKWAQSSLFPKYAFHVKDYTPGFPYYGLPSWYGTREWLKLANKIPVWHNAGIDNGYVVRYLVEISESYFVRFAGDDAKIREAKQKLQRDIEACMSGASNVGKTIYTVMSPQEFAEKGIIRITPISADLHDEAFSVLFNQSNTATTSGFSMHSTLSGIDTAGKLSSGSETREQFNIWHKLHATRPRERLLSVLETIKIVNGWDKTYPGLQFGIENISLETLDKNPTGVQTVMPA